MQRRIIILTAILLLATLPRISFGADAKQPLTPEQNRAFFSTLSSRLAQYIMTVNEALRGPIQIADDERDKLIKALNHDASFAQQQSIIIDKAKTPTDLTARITELKQYWRDRGNELKYAVARTRAVRIETTLTRMEALQDKLNTLITNLKSKNVNVTKINASYTTLKENTTSARTEYDAAVADMQKLKAGDQSASFTSIKDHLANTHQSLTTAHDVLVDLVATLRLVIPDTTTLPTQP